MPRGIPNKPRAARVEGEGVISEPAATRPRKDPDSDRMSSEALAFNIGKAIEVFQERFPGEWEELRLCPLQHGIDTIVGKLNS